MADTAAPGPILDDQTSDQTSGSSSGDLTELGSCIPDEDDIIWFDGMADAYVYDYGYGEGTGPWDTLDLRGAAALRELADYETPEQQPEPRAEDWLGSLVEFRALNLYAAGGIIFNQTDPNMSRIGLVGTQEAGPGCVIRVDDAPWVNRRGRMQLFVTVLWSDGLMSRESIDDLQLVQGPDSPQAP